MNNQLAQQGLEIRARIDALTLQLRQITEQLVADAGTDGETASFPEGKVVITARTADRPSGVFIQRFNMDAFNELPETNALRKKIVAAGLVSFEPGVTKGRDPVVQFRLNTNVTSRIRG